MQSFRKLAYYVQLFSNKNRQALLPDYPRAILHIRNLKADAKRS